ncbi:Pyrrolo-quinoline quinone repeat-containing protein [Candidatus Cyrtobacter comes]|uniref:Pyrrolo-quinoline quinone repeat-containing protein n=1 Tax=Candidatus Cyrtobacter comes TaxID=675776 RepID=A0ABU5L851_9RICK|nr:PQQ-binding-like beta-propeller repeat protein [Candidatus Cyrtobacter comes]MDZ5762304.1 Pyrrolo-quinoline quinone repeat-containing protein [Candidatus Cyrtobacter comes]
MRVTVFLLVLFSFLASSCNKKDKEISGERVSFINEPKKVRENRKLNCDTGRTFSFMDNKLLDLYKSRYTSPLTKPLVVGSDLFVLDDNANVLSFNLESKKLLWKRKLGFSNRDLPYGSMSYNSNALFITYGAKDVICLDAITGFVIWRCDLAQRVRSKPLILEGKVIVQTISNEIFAIDQKTGKVIWSAPSSNFNPQIIQIKKIYAYKDMILYMDNNFLNCVSLTSGQLLYSHDMISNNVISGISRVQNSNFIESFLTVDKHDPSLLYVYSADSIYALRLLEKGILVLWYARYIPQTYVSECNGMLYFVDMVSNLIALDKNTGVTVLSINLNNEVINQHMKRNILHWYTPVPISGGLLIMNKEGNFMEYNFKSHKITQKKDANGTIEVEPILTGNDAIYFMLKDSEYQVKLLN